MKDDFWTGQIETGAIINGYGPIFLKVHESREAYYELDTRLERDFLTHHRGLKTHILAKPCVAAQNMQPIQAGNAQAWYYPQDGVLVLWECYLYDWVRKSPRPVEDPRHLAVWQAFEQEMIGRFSPRLVVTPAWEPVYETEDWQEFLKQAGYQIDGKLGVKFLEEDIPF